jgi:AcrR family transcriptional regulator
MTAPLKGDERPMRADAARNRVRILEAARTVFAARGLDGTMDDIAQEAGLGVGTVYRRFADREALVDALFEEAMESQVGRAEAALADPDPARAFESFLRETCAEMAHDRGLRTVLLNTAVGRDRVSSARERIDPLAKQIVERAKQAGALREDFRQTDVPMLMLMASAVADITGDVAPGVWERYVALFLDALRPEAARTDLSRLPSLADDDLASAMCTWKPARR